MRFQEFTYILDCFVWLTKWLHHSNITISARWSSCLYNYFFFHILILQCHHCVMMASSWHNNLIMSSFSQFDKTHISVLLCSSIHYILVYSTTTLFCDILSSTIFNFACTTSASLSLNVCTTFVHTSSSCCYSSFRHVSQDKYLLSLRQWLANVSVVRWQSHKSW